MAALFLPQSQRPLHIVPIDIAMAAAPHRPSLRHTLARVHEFLGRYRAHLSAASMVIGFISDNLLLSRVDLPGTQALLAGYLLMAGAGLLLLHAAETRSGKGFLKRWRNLFPPLIQFALGSIWSGLLVFYGRSAVIASAWPFLLLLAAIFIGNELFHRYVARLVFATTLFYFALFFFAVLEVPVYVHAIGPWVFLLAGILASGVFVGFIRVLRAAGGVSLKPLRFQITAGAVSVFATLNFFYFTGILPPLPLALTDSGAYHSIKKDGDVYMARGEAASWAVKLGWPQTLHLAPGQPAYVFSSVFAPIKLDTQIAHVWEWYSPAERRWVKEGTIRFAVFGGRGNGYRGYSLKHDPKDGDWRVDIETASGHLIGRVRFRIVHDGDQPELTMIMLR